MTAVEEGYKITKSSSDGSGYRVYHTRWDCWHIEQINTPKKRPESAFYTEEDVPQCPNCKEIEENDG